MDILDIVVRFYITVGPSVKVQMVIVWLRSQTSLYDDVSMGKCIPSSRQSSWKLLVLNFMRTSYIVFTRKHYK